MTLSHEQRTRTLQNQYAANIARLDSELTKTRLRRKSAIEQGDTARVAALDQEIASTEAFIARQKQRASEVKS